MNDKEKVLKYIDKNGWGVEIGPSHNPVAQKKEGYKVHIIDHMNQEALIKKYRDHQVILENIEEVDFIWQGESYSELTGKNNFYDWIIASQVIEHTPDLIGFLNDCDSILKDDGVLSLVVPDKRYCFDHFRPITGLAKIIDSHYQRNTIHTPGSVAEYYLNVVSKANITAWDPSITGTYACVHSLEDATQGMKSVLNDKTFIDVHAWCFVPQAFRLLIHDLYCLDLTPFKEVGFFPTENHLFYMTLSRKGKGIDKSRIEMLNSIDAEIKEGISTPEEKTLPNSIMDKIKHITNRAK